MLQTGGSSSGPGIGVNANLAPIAIGTETSGSILSPANANGIVGIKPTVGLVSRDGIIPITADQDTAGPMTRTVTDAAILLGVIAGYDPNDPATAACLIPGNCFSDYTQFLNPRALRGARIAVYSPPTRSLPTVRRSSTTPWPDRERKVRPYGPLPCPTFRRSPALASPTRCLRFRRRPRCGAHPCSFTGSSET